MTNEMTIGLLEGSLLVLWLMAIIHSLLILGLVRGLRQLQLGVTGGEARLRTGALAPEFAGVDLQGKPIDKAQLLERETALLFVSPGCPSCTATMYEMEALDFKTQGGVVVICRGSVEEAELLAQTHPLEVRIVPDPDDKIARAFGISASPTAVLIDGDFRIRSYGQPLRGEDIADLLMSSTIDQPVGAGNS
jgi:peroxiredoxin